MVSWGFSHQAAVGLPESETHVDELLASFIDAGEFLKSVVQMIESAQMRLIATGCAAVER